MNIISTFLCKLRVENKVLKDYKITILQISKEIAESFVQNKLY